MNENLLYLDTYLLQKDMRVRLPKAILSNMNLIKGVSQFDVFFDSNNKCLILKPHIQSAAQEDKND